MLRAWWFGESGKRVETDGDREGTYGLAWRA